MTDPSTQQEPATGSLQGLRVLEIGTSVAAPFAGQILGDLGAEVVKIERPCAGDDARSWAPPHWDGRAVTFLALNRNKSSLTLDFKDPRGREVLEELIRRSDVLVQNLRPGALAAAGFGAQRVRELNPRLVHCELTGYGAAGPRAEQAAYDPLLQAYSGIVSITGQEGGDPVRVPLSVLDIGTGMWTALAVLEALRRRDVTGTGCHVELSLLQTAMAWLGPQLMSVRAGNGVPGRLGSGLAGVVPYGAYPTSDGHVFLSAGNQPTWERLCSALGRTDLAAAAGFESNEERVRHRVDVDAALAEATAGCTAAALLSALAEARVPCAPVHTLDQVLADEQVRATGVITDLDHPGVPGFEVVNLPMTFDGRYPAHRAAPPALGQHSVATLRELGISSDAVDELLHARVITEDPG